MAVQDDRREIELRELFRLSRDENEGRSGTDAILILGDSKIPFELKSTTGGGVTTVRDFAPSHIAKWKDRHWLIGFYDRAGTQLLYSLYGSPQKMAPWINKKEDYVRPDILLASLLPSHVTMGDMIRICGDKLAYSLTDARNVQKNQYSSSEYRSRMDLDNGYSREAMLAIVRDRARYLLLRGSTLNNPHIPLSYFRGWPHIIEHHAETLRKLVLESLADAG